MLEFLSVYICEFYIFLDIGICTIISIFPFFLYWVMPSLELNLVNGSVVKTSWRRSFTMSFVGLDQLAWLFFSSSSLGERRDQCAWRESALPSRRIIIRPSDFFPRSRCQTCGISIKQPTKASIGTEQTTETMVTFLTPWHDRIPWTGWGGCSRRNNCGANATVPSIEVYGQLGVGKNRHLYALSSLISSRIYVYSIYWKAIFL